MSNKADLYQPVENIRVGPPPIVLRTIITPRADGLVEGMPTSAKQPAAYVLVSALPEDLQRRIQLAVQAIAAAK